MTSYCESDARSGGNAEPFKARRRPGAATIASTLLLGLTFAVWLAAFFGVGVWRNPGVVSGSFHTRLLGPSEGCLFGGVVFFDGKRGPHLGEMYAYELSHEGHEGEPRYRIVNWYDSFGVYWSDGVYNHSGKTYWTFAISLLYVFALFAILPMRWVWLRWQLRNCVPCFIAWLGVVVGLALNVWAVRLTLPLLDCAPGLEIRPMGMALCESLLVLVGLFVGVPISIVGICLNHDSRRSLGCLGVLLNLAVLPTGIMTMQFIINLLHLKNAG